MLVSFKTLSVTAILFEELLDGDVGLSVGDVEDRVVEVDGGNEIYVGSVSHLPER
jgi:hypothetical protein